LVDYFVEYFNRVD